MSRREAWGWTMLGHPHLLTPPPSKIHLFFLLSVMVLMVGHGIQRDLRA
jgi:hypothetical protein